MAELGGKPCPTAYTNPLKFSIFNVHFSIVNGLNPGVSVVCLV